MEKSEHARRIISALNPEKKVRIQKHLVIKNYCAISQQSSKVTIHGTRTPICSEVTCLSLVLQ